LTSSGPIVLASDGGQRDPIARPPILGSASFVPVHNGMSSTIPSLAREAVCLITDSRPGSKRASPLAAVKPRQTTHDQMGKTKE
jgi:hypothetical protein